MGIAGQGRAAHAFPAPVEGYYNVERMLKRVAGKGCVLLCGTCMDARALSDGGMMDGARLESARGQVAGLLGCEPDEVVFTKGGDRCPGAFSLIPTAGPDAGHHRTMCLIS